METRPTEDEMLYQARLQSLKERYAKDNEIHNSCALSNDEIREYIKTRIKEAKWAKGGTKTVNNLDPLTWVAIFLLSMAASSMIFLMYLIAKLG